MRIAFVGLGAMGLPIARRLSFRQDVELALFDVAEARLAEAQGLGRVASSVADATREADAVFTVLPADGHVESVAREVAASGRRGLVFVDFSTIAPQTIERIAASLATAGIGTVSIAVTRGTAAARAGELALFVGGPLSPDLRTALESTATEIRTTGGLGSAKAVKLGNNAVVACIDVGICELIVLGAKLGLDGDAVADALAARGVGGWPLRNHIVKHVLADDLGPGGFSTRHMAKDVALFIGLARAGAVPTPLAGVAAAGYRGTIGAGFGDDYHPVVIRWLEQTAPAEPARPGSHGADKLAILAEAGRGIELLATRESLGALRAAGITPSEAAGHLASGSAANGSLQAVCDLLGGGDAGAIQADVLLALDRALSLADAAAVPATMLEAARHAAMGLSG